MKRGIGGELLVFMNMRMRTKTGRGVILVKDIHSKRLWDRGLKILETLLGSWKLELVCTLHFEVGERVADG
jgi:hypothetical protein